MTNCVIRLEDRKMRARERVELVTEGTTALTLLSSVQASIAGNDFDAFAAINAVAGAALVIAVIMGARNLRRSETAATGVNLVGVFGGLAGIVEGVHRLHRAHFTFGQKHFALGALTVFTGLLTATIAFMNERLEHGRTVTIDDAGIRMRLNKFRRFTAAWSDIVSIQVTPKELQLLRLTGRPRVVPLHRLLNRVAVSAAILNAASARNVPVHE